MGFNCSREDLGYEYRFFFLVIKVTGALEQLVQGGWEAPPLQIFKKNLDQYIPEVILAQMIMPSGRKDG